MEQIGAEPAGIGKERRIGAEADVAILIVGEIAERLVDRIGLAVIVLRQAARALDEPGPVEGKGFRLVAAARWLDADARQSRLAKCRKGRQGQAEGQQETAGQQEGVGHGKLDLKTARTPRQDVDGAAQHVD